MRHRIAAWSTLIVAMTMLVAVGAFAATDRNDAPPEHKWDFSHIYPDFDAWEADYDRWRQRDLSRRRYVYVWADGVYSNVRMDDRLCLLVIVGSDDTGRKEVLAVVDGYRESEASWLEVLEQLESQGLTIPPKLAIGDGALGFWKAVAKKWPQTCQQRCWVHKTANVLNKVPKAVQPKLKAALHEIWMAETRKGARKAFDDCVKRFEAKYPKAVECLLKDKEAMLAFYDFPAMHWQHIRTTNPIESVFATVRLRTAKMKNCGSRTTTLTMAWQLMTTAQKRWRRLRGYKLLADVVKGVKFKDGEPETLVVRQTIFGPVVYSHASIVWRACWARVGKARSIG